MAVTVSRELVASVTAGIKDTFKDQFAAQSGVAMMLATMVVSTLPVETYAWLSEYPQMREFGDERAIKRLLEYSYAIRNRKFESTLAIERDLLEDDQLGQIRMRAMQYADAAAEHYDQILFQLIRLAEAVACYDGIPFYSHNHVFGGLAVSNLTDLPFNALNLQTVMTAMQRILLDNGEPMAVKPSVLLIPPELSFQAQTVLNSIYYPDGTVTGGPGAFSKNPLQGRLTIVETARLPTATEWHVLDCTHSVKPFIIQQRIMPELMVLDGSDGESQDSFMRDIYLYGLRSRDAAGFGLWQYAYKSTGEAD